MITQAFKNVNKNQKQNGNMLPQITHTGSQGTEDIHEALSACLPHALLKSDRADIVNSGWIVIT